MSNPYRLVADSVITDTLAEKTASGGVNVSSDLRVNSAKLLNATTIVAGIADTSAPNFSHGLTATVVTATDYHEGSAGAHINLHEDVVCSTQVTSPTVVLTNLTATAGTITATDNVTLSAGKTLTADTLAANTLSTRSGTTIAINNNVSMGNTNVITTNQITGTGTPNPWININNPILVTTYVASNELRANQLTSQSGTNITVESGKTLNAPILTTDTLSEYTTSHGVTIANPVTLSSVSTDSSPTELLTINSNVIKKTPNPYSLDTLNYVDIFDDFSGVVATFLDTSSSLISCDLPWYLYASPLTELQQQTDYESSYIDPTGTMLGAVYFRWTTPGANTQRFFCLSNGSNLWYANGKITVTYRLRLQETTSSTTCLAQEALTFGLGRPAANSSGFDLDGVVGFNYDSTSDTHWGCIYGGAGATVPSITYGTNVVDNSTHTFKITVEDAGSGNATVTWFIDNVQVYTAVVSGLGGMGPRLVHSYTKNTNALPTNGVGVIMDLVRVTQPWSRN